jgi:predicted glycosyltransferase involved in capsule biosynthesis
VCASIVSNTFFSSLYALFLGMMSCINASNLDIFLDVDVFGSGNKFLSTFTF